MKKKWQKTFTTGLPDVGKNHELGRLRFALKPKKYWSGMAFGPVENPHGIWVISHVPIFHITQPLGINGLLDGYYKVMSNIPKMGHLPTPMVFGSEW